MQPALAFAAPYRTVTPQGLPLLVVSADVPEVCVSPGVCLMLHLTGARLALQAASLAVGLVVGVVDKPCW